MAKLKPNKEYKILQFLIPATIQEIQDEYNLGWVLIEVRGAAYIFERINIHMSEENEHDRL